MTRTTAICAAAALLAPSPVRADDAQLWITAGSQFTLVPGATAMAEISQRFREDSPDQLLLRANLDLAVARGVAPGGGLTHVRTGRQDEWRPHQQLTLTQGPIALRTRLEERLFEGAGRAQLRLRQRVQYARSLSPAARTSLSGELFYIARSQHSGGSARTEQWRVNAVLTRRIAQRLDLAAGYLLIRTPVRLAPDRTSHVAQLSLVVRP